MVKSREAKELLSNKNEVTVDAILNSGEEVHVTITAEIFQEITKHLIAKTMSAIKKALRDASVDADDIDGVVMVGGATRMPHVQRAVSEYFHTIPHANIDPDKVVALGAAVQAICWPATARRRRLAAARCDSAVARYRDDGRPGREDHSA